MNTYLVRTFVRHFFEVVCVYIYIYILSQLFFTTTFKVKNIIFTLHEETEAQRNTLKIILSLSGKGRS